MANLELAAGQRRVCSGSAASLQRVSGESVVSLISLFSYPATESLVAQSNDHEIRDEKQSGNKKDGVDVFEFALGIFHNNV